MAASDTALVSRTHTKKHASTPTSTLTHTHPQAHSLTHTHTRTPTRTHSHTPALFRRNDLYLFQEKILILEKWSFSRARSTTFFQDQHKSEKRDNKVLSNQHLLEKKQLLWLFWKQIWNESKKGFIFDFFGADEEQTRNLARNFRPTMAIFNILIHSQWPVREITYEVKIAAIII